MVAKVLVIYHNGKRRVDSRYGCQSVEEMLLWIYTVKGVTRDQLPTAKVMGWITEE